MSFSSFEIRQTADGSSTIYRSDIDETYHSTHGAIQESQHVFIQNGLNFFGDDKNLRILEVGFGTGLNALLTLTAIEGKTNQVEYHSLEAIPLPEEIWSNLFYVEQLGAPQYKTFFNDLHQTPWNVEVNISPGFMLKKIDQKLQDVTLPEDYFGLVYYDAFGPRAQGEMWAIENFEKLIHCMKKDAILVTYCAKGSFKRDLKSLGFEIESLPGPPGKREMTRAFKKS